jgi:hypothetical protein
MEQFVCKSSQPLAQPKPPAARASQELPVPDAHKVDYFLVWQQVHYVIAARADRFAV